MARDVVCGMYVDENTTRFRLDRRGRTYYFCSRTCYDEFLRPEREIRRYRDLSIISLAVGAMTMLSDFVAISPDTQLTRVAIFLLVTPIQFGAGYVFYRGLLDALRSRQANMDSLIAIGTSAAYFYSVVATFFPQMIQQGAGEMPPTYFADSALIIGLILLGRFLEHSTKQRASESVTRLLELQPPMATLVQDGLEKEVRVEEVRVDDTLAVRPGSRIPVDGQVMEGSSSADMSPITGESIPVDISPGSQVFAGSVNLNGFVKIRTTRTVADSTLSQITGLIEEAILTRSPAQKLADAIASRFVPIVVLTSILSFSIWLFLGRMPLSFALTTAIAVLIIACPCALGLATPAALTVGFSRAAQFGVLIKGGEELERVRKVTMVVFDKTGTLTTGRPSVVSILPRGGMRELDVLLFSASAEAGSEHPIAKAILEEAKRREIKPDRADLTKVLPGGLRSVVNGRQVIVGTKRLIETEGLRLDQEMAKKLSESENLGNTAFLVALDGDLIGILAVADVPKIHSREAVELLARRNIETAMLTGDNQIVADAIAGKLGIGEVIAGVLPQDKIDIVRGLRSENRIIAMVGDGINDAPALAAADVGIAMGGGTDVAKETGQIILVGDDPRGVALAIDVSRLISRKIRENLFWAFVYNVALIPLAAGVLYPLTGVLLSPIFSALAMAMSSMTVTLNSLSLSRYRPEWLEGRTARSCDSRESLEFLSGLH